MFDDQAFGEKHDKQKLDFRSSPGLVALVASPFFLREWSELKQLLEFPKVARSEFVTCALFCFTNFYRYGRLGCVELMKGRSRAETTMASVTHGFGPKNVEDHEFVS